MTQVEENIDLFEARWSVSNAFFWPQSTATSISSVLVKPQIDSFNSLINDYLPDIVEKHSPTTFVVPAPASEDGGNSQIDNYRIVVNFSNMTISKPSHTDKHGVPVPIPPHQTRVRGITYQSALYVDVMLTVIALSSSGEEVWTQNAMSKHTKFGMLPIMVRSAPCILSNMTHYNFQEMKEDPLDPGAHFIIGGGEKVLISQETMRTNYPFLFQNKTGKHPWTCEIKSRPRDAYDSVSSTVLKITKNGEIVVQVKPGWIADIPVVILFRALGIISDKDITQMIIYNEDDEELFHKFIPSLIYSVDEKDRKDKKNSEKVTTYEGAMNYIANRIVTRKMATKDYEQQMQAVIETLTRSVLPHVGTDFRDKAIYLGYMCNRLLGGILGRLRADIRDNTGMKRVDTAGILLAKLISPLFSKMIDNMRTSISKQISTGGIKTHDMETLIPRGVRPQIVEQQVRHALTTGNWSTTKNSGPSNPTAQGVAQVLERKSMLGALSATRRVVTPQKGEVKLTQTRQLDPSQAGMLCPSETPEGQNVGIVKNMALSCQVTGYSSELPVLEALNDFSAIMMEDINVTQIGSMCKIFLDGAWIACTENPIDLIKKLRGYRRRLIINPEIEMSLEAKANTINISTDAGRLIRPLLIVDPGNKLRLTPEIGRQVRDGKLKWNDLLQETDDRPAIVEYIGVTEGMEDILVATKTTILTEKDPVLYRYTHCEIDPSLILGVSAIMIPFADHNQAPRNTYQSAMGKQAIGVYALNWQWRLDSVALVMRYPEIPLVYTRASRYTGLQYYPAGTNSMVAIMCYTGYNQEDSLLFNCSAGDRHFMRVICLKTTKDEQRRAEEKYKKPDPTTTLGIKPGSYEHLDDRGFVKVGSVLNAGDVIIGKVQKIKEVRGLIDSKDISHVSKDGPVTIDMVALSTQADGFVCVKVRSVFRKNY